jgi:hypothetical protein
VPRNHPYTMQLPADQRVRSAALTASQSILGGGLFAQMLFQIGIGIAISQNLGRAPFALERVEEMEPRQVVSGGGREVHKAAGNS